MYKDLPLNCDTTLRNIHQLCEPFDTDLSPPELPAKRGLRERSPQFAPKLGSSSSWLSGPRNQHLSYNKQ